MFFSTRSCHAHIISQNESVDSEIIINDARENVNAFVLSGGRYL
jgi:hypothetical protein